nr:retrovirus-related Pol polyprotein from transposon TNT 1-94 [Tanacetum cinerariifolium]
MLDRTDFASWQQRIRLYCRGKENRVNILKSIDEGPYKIGTVRETLAESTEGAPQFGFAKLINDMRNIKMTMSRLQLNSKFVNNMLPEWGRFVTAVKLNRGLRDSNYDKLYAYLKQHETYAKHYLPSSSASSFTQVPPPLADSSSPAEDLIENLTNTLALLTSYRTFLPQTNNQLQTSSNARNQATGGNAVGYRGAQNRVGNVNQGQARPGQARTVKCCNCNALDAEQLLFLADVDEAPTTQTMFMANLLSADPITDEAGPSYVSDILEIIHQHQIKILPILIPSFDTDRTPKVQTTYFQITKLTGRITHLQAQNDLFRAENDKIKHHYKELYDSIKITRAKHIEQHAIDVEPIIPHLRNNRDAHLDYLRHLKESVEIIRDIVEEAKVLAHIPLIGKKKVTVAKPSDKSDRTTYKHVVTVKTQTTNVLVPPSIGVNSCSNAGGSQPKSHVKPNRISPAKSVNKLPVEDQPRTVPRTPQQNDIVERQNRTLIEAAQTMLIFSKALMFLWAEAVATAYKLRPRTKFSSCNSLCTPTNKELEILFQPMFDEHLEPPSAERLVSPIQAVQAPVNSAGTPSSTTTDQDAPIPSISPSLQPTTDTRIFVGYAPSRKGYRIYNKRNRRIIETIHVQFDELTEPMVPVHLSIGPAPNFLTPVQPPVSSAGTPLSTTIDQDTPSPHISPSSSAPQSHSLPPGVVAEPHFMKDHNVTLVDNNPFVNVFASEPQSEASSSGDISSTESPYVSQTVHHLNK